MRKLRKAGPALAGACAAVLTVSLSARVETRRCKTRLSTGLSRYRVAPDAFQLYPHRGTEDESSTPVPLL